MRAAIPAPRRPSAVRLTDQAGHESSRPTADEVWDERDERAGRERDEGTGGGGQWRADRPRIEADFLEDEQADGMVRIGEDGIDEPIGLLGAESALDVELGQDRPLLVGGVTELLALEGQLVVEQLPLALDRDVLADAHAEGAGDEPGHTGEHDDPVV